MNTQSSRIAEVLASKAMEAYKTEIAEWREACRVWAEAWTAKLWQPWELIKVRYTPVRMPEDFDCANSGTDELIQEVAVINGIADCVGIGANLTEVRRIGGNVREVVIGAFLDARVIEYSVPSTTEFLPYHRPYAAGGYVVNVPAFVVEQPEPAPEKPVTPNGLKEIFDGEELPF